MKCPEMKCSDCGFTARVMNESTLRKGSTVREPGEPLCASCSSHRVKMMKELEKIPTRLSDIRALRNPRVGAA